MTEEEKKAAEKKAAEEKAAAEKKAAEEAEAKKKAEEKKFSEAEVKALVEKEKKQLEDKLKSLSDIEKELAELKKEKMSEQERAIAEAKEAAAKEFEPDKSRLQKLAETINTLLDMEMADIPEDKKDLVPEFSTPEEKLDWVKKAKAKGLFGNPKGNSSSNIPPGGAPNKGQEKSDDMAKLAEEDPKAYFKKLREKNGIRVRGFNSDSNPKFRKFGNEIEIRQVRASEF